MLKTSILSVSLKITNWGLHWHLPGTNELTHWGRVTHICIDKLTIIGSDNGLSPGRRQAIIWTNVGILLIGTLRTNFSEILSEIHTFSFKKMHLKISSAKWRPFCLGLNELKAVKDQSFPMGLLWLQKQLLSCLVVAVWSAWWRCGLLMGWGCRY